MASLSRDNELSAPLERLRVRERTSRSEESDLERLCRCLFNFGRPDRCLEDLGPSILLNPQRAPPAPLAWLSPPSTQPHQ
jgi:hypothetical protein